MKRTNALSKYKRVDLFCARLNIAQVRKFNNLMERIYCPRNNFHYLNIIK